jgi:hypothetical protein
VISIFITGLKIGKGTQGGILTEKSINLRIEVNMTKIIDFSSAPGKRILMEMFENGKKVAEQDISDWTPRHLTQLIEIQELMGRVWEYKTINLKNGR